jgi:H+/Cl- antiporter ClcA
MAWLEDVTAAVSAAGGVDEVVLTLDASTRKEILDLARIASHASGDRINAPLLCYALGVAVGRGASLGKLGPAVRAAAGDDSD